MKKLLTCLASLTIAASSTVPVLTNVTQTNLQKQDSQAQSSNDDRNINDDENKNAGDKIYQAKAKWENYFSKNQGFISIIKSIGRLGSEYQYKETDLGLEIIKDKDQPMGQLLMNGKVQTTVDNPSVVSQHVVDNSQGSNPIAVDYEPQTIINNATLSASFSANLSTSIANTKKVVLPFTSANVSTSLSFNTNVSSSVISSAPQTITFGRVSTTVNPGDKVEINYALMQNLQVFNMVLKGKLDLSNCKFNFEDSSKNKRSVAWSDVAKDKNCTQLFSREISKSLSPYEIANGIQPLFSVDRISEPNVPEESWIYNPNIVYIYLPLSLSLDGYSTLITQSKLTE